MAYSPRLECASFHPLLDNGPASNRLDIVFLSEGYTSNQVSKFLVDCTNSLNALLTRTPFSEYRGHFNAAAIAVASKQSGSDHPAYGLFRETYFNSTYDAVSDYLLTIPAGSAGQTKADEILNTYMPAYDLAVLLVNDVVFGGSDGGGRMAIVSTAPASSAIMAHEMAHVIAGLGDEYERPYPGYPDIEHPNTTRESRRDFIKWKEWIAESTPIPTPETFDYFDIVGLFEGAHYHATGWFRPKLDCAMNSMQAPFCEVCREALVLSFYQRCQPVEGRSPGQNSLILPRAENITFGLQLLQPANAPLTVEWDVNGRVAKSGTNAQFLCEAALLRTGSNTVSALVLDSTYFVRNDPGILLRRSVNWQVIVQQSALSLVQAHFSEAGRFVFRIAGWDSGSVAVQFSSNLGDWEYLSTNNPALDGTWVTNRPPPSGNRGFYRLAR